MSQMNPKETLHNTACILSSTTLHSRSLPLMLVIPICFPAVEMRKSFNAYGYRLDSGIAIYTWWVTQSLQLEINNSYHFQTISIFLWKILFSFLSSKSLRYWDCFGRSLHTLFLMISEFKNRDLYLFHMHI